MNWQIHRASDNEAGNISISTKTDRLRRAVAREEAAQRRTQIRYATECANISAMAALGNEEAIVSADNCGLSVDGMTSEQLRVAAGRIRRAKPGTVDTPDDAD